ncbi:peptidase inhibitor family I36 protein [Paractinoplanes atraurantiacus]|uniref:Peptidase inhibitor family I36 n=1 Tax=Paractinoplanes atraurantiacus TaxID=1036182 RepID=A0A285GTQ2_9ACTN|nr:peptidase inhibitor family I36 protein [Actinoplanes atraurantiacus]SNY25886.1 Peptidase inhibitor family I36 [Actinoplanes atraurantiacus]
MSKTVILRGLVGAASAVAGAVALLPGAAQAAYVCPANAFCMYKNLNATGTVSVQAALNTGASGYLEDFRNSHYSNGESLENSVSSVVNNTGGFVYLYDEWKRQGTWVVIYPHSGTTNLDNATIFPPDGNPYKGNYNDRLTSAWIVYR